MHWVRPESKSRVITVEQMRELMQEIYLKPNEAEYKVAVIEAADRLNTASRERVPENARRAAAEIRFDFAHDRAATPSGNDRFALSEIEFWRRSGPIAFVEQMQWLTQFGEMAASEQKSLLGRYRLLGLLLNDWARCARRSKKR